MPKSAKGKCGLSENAKKEHQYLQKSDKEGYVMCTKCNSIFSIASGGMADINRHVNSSKHKTALNALAGSSSITTYFASSVDLRLAAQEGVWAYHVVNSNHSFASSDCASRIFRNCFGKQNFSCSQTKCRAIILSVYGAHAKEILFNELKQRRYISIYIDASNHGNIKLFPVMVRFFNALEGVQVRMLNISSEKGETSDTIVQLLHVAINKYELNNKVVCFSGDNAKVNFGGPTRGGHNNVFSKLKKSFPHIIGIGCVAHIEHNTIKKACDVLPFDVEWVIVKTYSHFYRYTCRAEGLKTFCAEANTEYFQLLGYAKTRFIALAPALERILHLYQALKNYFDVLPQGEKLLRDFYLNKSSKFWLMFIAEQAKLFNTCILKIEGDEITAIEVAHHISCLKDTLKQRAIDLFLTSKTEEEKLELVKGGMGRATLERTCKQFFDDACEYLTLWTATFEELRLFSWVTLEETPTWENVKLSIKRLHDNKLYNLPEKEAQFHTQFGYLTKYCDENKLEEWRTNNTTVVKRWVEIFRHFYKKKLEYEDIAALMEYILCLPGTNSSVERHFSSVNVTWTYEKTRLTIEVLKAILFVKCNLKQNCIEFYKYLLNNEHLLRQIASNDKYKFKTEEGEEFLMEDDRDSTHDLL